MIALETVVCVFKGIRAVERNREGDRCTTLPPVTAFRRALSLSSVSVRITPIAEMDTVLSGIAAMGVSAPDSLDL